MALTIETGVAARGLTETTRPKRVLIVDDERTNRELLEAFLTGFGHEIDMAADGLEALAKLDGSHDLVLLDVMMPGIDGFEVARRIRTESSCFDVPICMVTALSGREQRLHAVESGANDFIAKPIDKMELKIRTASLLRAKEAQDVIKGCQVKLEEQARILQKNYEELQEAEELKGEFLGIASHDLKNPLTCILGFTTLIQHLAPPGAMMTEKTFELLARIVLHTRNMEAIIKNFLDFQIMEDGQFKRTTSSVDLNSIARSAMEQNAGNAEQKQITLSLDLDESLPRVLADSSQIGQVVDNLVSNALKFGAVGGHTMIATRQLEGSVFLEVTDSGPGLSEEDLAMLFVKYAKLSNKPTGAESSTGLGLAICKKMIDLNGGEIGGRNNEGEGATFWFRLPVIVPH